MAYKILKHSIIFCKLFSAWVIACECLEFCDRIEQYCKCNLANSIVKETIYYRFII